VISVRHKALLSLFVTGVAGAVLGAWATLAFQAALEGRILLVAGSAALAALLLAGALARRFLRLLPGPAAAEPADDVAVAVPPKPPERPGSFPGSPELARVSVSFGRMVDELERRNREVVEHRDQLQAELLERTRELTVIKEAADRPAPPLRSRPASGRGHEPPTRPARRRA
jgi:hypothetical protein